MKILLVSSKYMPEYSGSGFRAHNLYKRLCAKYPKELELCGILAGSETENNIEQYKYDCLSVCRVACKKYLNLSSNFLLRRFQNWMNFRSEFRIATAYLNNMKEKPDLIHIFGKNYLTTAALVFAISHSIPAMIELCNEMDSPDFYIPIPSRFFIHSTPTKNFKYVCISERLKNVCLKNGVPENNIWCRPNPIDEKKFFPVSDNKKLEIRQRITGLGGDVKLLSYVAKIIPRKNHLFLLDVIEKLPENYTLFIGGPTVVSGMEFQRDSSLLHKIETEIQNRNLSQRVIFKTGFFNNIDEIYKMSDIYLFPTEKEGLGTPLLEALACGTPVVANKIKGITDIWIENGKNGFISELNPDSFAEKISLAEKIPYSTRLAEAEKILSKASCKVIDELYIKNFMELLWNA